MRIMNVKSSNVNATALGAEQSEDSSPMEDFYKDTCIFLTGASGFLGKLTLQKLLVSTEVKTIYVLMRSKKGVDPPMRLEKLLMDKVFDTMKKATPNYRQRIIGVAGDCSLPNLGIQPDMRRELIEKVNIIFHGAATVRFDEKLALAAAINVQGTITMLALATEMKHLKSYVHISTAYSNCVHREIKEEFYPPSLTSEKLLQLVECVDEETCEKITPIIIKDWPNTYTFSKCIAEDVVRRSSHGLPVAIVRPSVVLCTFKDPIPGWVGNLYGPTGLLLACSTGLIRAARLDMNSLYDLIPADLVVNACLAAAWKRAQILDMNRIEIYNCVSGSQNPLYCSDFVKTCVVYGYKYPSEKCVWSYSLLVTKNEYLFNFCHYVGHLMLGHIIDIGLRLRGKTPFMTKLYHKIFIIMSSISYFALNSWHFHDDNMQEMWKMLSPKDRKTFNFNIGTLSWAQFFDDAFYGMRQNVLKEDVNTLPAAKRRIKRFKTLHGVLRYSFIIILLWILYKICTIFF